MSVSTITIHNGFPGSHEEYSTISSISNYLKERYSDELKSVDGREIRSFIMQVVDYEPSQRFVNADGSYAFDPNMLEALDEMRGSLDPLVKRAITEKKRGSKQERAINDVIDCLVGHYIRPTAACMGYRQEAGHINNNGKLVPGQTLSSEFNKKKIALLSTYNLNLMGIHDDLGNHICCRSGRSDSVEQIHRLIRFNFFHSFRSNNQPGIRYDDDGYPHFQVTIVSAQGNKYRKPSNSVVLKQLAPPHHEHESLENIIEAINTIWDTSMPVAMSVTLDDGELIPFLAEPPILKIYPLSSGAIKGTVRQKARQWSRSGAIKEVYYISKKQDLPKKIGAIVKQIPDYFLNITPEEQDLILTSIWDQLHLIVSNNLSQTEKRLYFTLMSIKITLTGTDFDGTKFTDPKDPGIELALSLQGDQFIDTAYSFQCKAGCDRTLIMVALFIAQKEMMKKYPDHVINWTAPKESSRELRSVFREIFDTIIEELGPTAFLPCRGSNEFKDEGKPFLDWLRKNFPKN